MKLFVKGAERAIYERIPSGITPQRLEIGPPPTEYAALAHVLAIMVEMDGLFAKLHKLSSEEERWLDESYHFISGVLWCYGIKMEIKFS